MSEKGLSTFYSNNDINGKPVNLQPNSRYSKQELLEKTDCLDLIRLKKLRNAL